jgi:hypothetical protein
MPRRCSSPDIETELCVCERIDADYPIVPFAPRISPHVQPLPNAGSEPGSGDSTSGVLGAGMLFLPDDCVSCEAGQRRTGRLGGPTGDGAAIGKKSGVISDNTSTYRVHRNALVPTENVRISVRPIPSFPNNTCDSRRVKRIPRPLLPRSHAIHEDQGQLPSFLLDSVSRLPRCPSERFPNKPPTHFQ